MKKTLFVISVLSFALCGYAQKSFTVSVPAFTSFFRVNAEGLNLRKAPDAASARLMKWYSDAGSDATETALFFSDNNRGRYRANRNTGAYVEACHPEEGELLPIIGESGDWYKVEFVAKGGYGLHKHSTVWVMKKFGDKVDIASGRFGGTHPAKPDVQWLTREEGLYKGLRFVGTVGDVVEYENYFTFYLEAPVIVADKYMYIKRVMIRGNIDADAVPGRLYCKTEENEWTGDMVKVRSVNFRSWKESTYNRFLLDMPDNDFGELVSEAMQKSEWDDDVSLYMVSDSGETVELPAYYMEMSKLPCVSETLDFPVRNP